MKSRSSPFVAAATALALCVQSTGAASIPAAMLPSAGTFPPSAARFGLLPAARLAPSPAPARKAVPAPSGPSWLESAKIVSDYFLARAQEALNPAPPPAEPPAPAESVRIEPAPIAISTPAEPPSVVTPLNPGVNSPRDRMMVVMEPGRHVEAVIDNNFRDLPRNWQSQPAFPNRTVPPYREKAVVSNGVRATLAYVGSHGTISGGPNGYAFSFPGAEPRLWPSASVTRAYWREFPVYFHNEEVEIELTVENRSGRTMTGVYAEVGQEIFNTAGGAGVRILAPRRLEVAASLAPGASAVVRWRTKLLGPADKPMNLEQTHVRVAADGSAAPLLDAPQAGVVDPPGPGLL